jgi:hypothetical protein
MNVAAFVYIYAACIVGVICIFFDEFKGHIK